MLRRGCKDSWQSKIFRYVAACSLGIGKVGKIQKKCYTRPLQIEEVNDAESLQQFLHNVYMNALPSKREVA